MKNGKNDARQKKDEQAFTCLDDSFGRLLRASWYDKEVTEFVTPAGDGHLISAFDVRDWLLKAKARFEEKAFRRN